MKSLMAKKSIFVKNGLDHYFKKVRVKKAICKTHSKLSFELMMLSRTKWLAKKILYLDSATRNM